MPLLPEGTLLDFTCDAPSADATLAVRSIRYKEMYKIFIRPEFSGERLRQAKNVDGSMPIIRPVGGGVPMQFFSNCNEDEERPLDPDDDRIDDIFKRFKIRHYEIEGIACLTTDIDALYSVSIEHNIRRARFDAHFEIVRGDVSIVYLTDVAQAEDFDFVTDTGLEMDGPALGAYGPEDNMMIIDYSPSVAYVHWLDAEEEDSFLMRDFSLIIERWELQPARQATP